MKKISLIVATMLLITGASGAYGYFFIYDKEDSEDSEIEKEQTQENNKSKSVIFQTKIKKNLDLFVLLFFTYKKYEKERNTN